MKEKLEFVEFLFKDLLKNTKMHIENEEKASKTGKFFSKSFMDKNHGKTALKRKIILLRQELLNLERMLDK